MRIHGKEQQPATPLADTLSALPSLLPRNPTSRDATGRAPKSHHHRSGNALGNVPLDALFQAQSMRQRALNQHGISEFEGDTSAAPRKNGTAISITRIEAYVKCPARDWYKNVLKLRDDDDLQEDPNARSTGSLLHKILETFIQESIDDYRRIPTPCTELTVRLHDIAERLIATDSNQPSMSEDGRDQLRRRWLPGLKDDAPKGILAVWLEREFANLPERFPMSVEVDIVGYTIHGRPVRGRIDRIDGVGPNGALIVDYKSGRAPGKSAIEKGLALQGILYAEALRPMLPKIDAFAALYSQLNAASDVKEDGWSGDSELLQPKVSARRVAAHDEESRAILLEHADRAVGALSRGLHHNTIATIKDAGCDYCSFHRICRHTDETVDAIRQDQRRCGPLEEER